MFFWQLTNHRTNFLRLSNEETKSDMNIQLNISVLLHHTLLMLLSSLSTCKKHECLSIDSSKGADNACATNGHRYEKSVCNPCQDSGSSGVLLDTAFFIKVKDEDPLLLEPY